jgi:hypothetical protein
MTRNWFTNAPRFVAKAADVMAQRVQRNSLFHEGQTVRLVTMNGCMATVRTNERTGVVMHLEKSNVYGSVNALGLTFVVIQLPDGTIEKRVAESRLWIRHTDGILEYYD